MILALNNLYIHQPLLDLVFCTYPKINNLSTVPGISDHDAITFHFDINKHSTSSVKQHKVPLYHRGNTELIKQDLAAFADNFLSSDKPDLSNSFGKNLSRPFRRLFQSTFLI